MPRPPEPLLPAEPAAVRLMNTVWADRTGLHDALTDVDDLRAFLDSIGMHTGSAVTLGRVASFRRLRDALTPSGHDTLVETVRGAGYRMRSSRQA